MVGKACQISNAVYKGKTKEKGRETQGYHLKPREKVTMEMVGKEASKVMRTISSMVGYTDALIRNPVNVRMGAMSVVDSVCNI